MSVERIVIPFHYCSLERAASFVSEVVGYRVEVEDLENRLKQNTLRGYVNFSDHPEYYSDDQHPVGNMLLEAHISADDENFERNYQDFFDTYIKSRDGSPHSGLLPWKWGHDQPYSRILPQLTQDSLPMLNIDDDGMDGISIETMAVPVGIWEVEQVQPFGVYEELFKHGVYKESEDSYRAIKFRRVPYTQFEWVGALEGYELRVEQIVLLDREVERLIVELDSSIDIRCLERPNLSQAGGYDEGLDNFSQSPVPRRERNTPSMQIRNVLASLIALHPELGEAVLREPYAVKDKLEVLCAQKGLNCPEVSKESIGNWLSKSDWKG